MDAGQYVLNGALWRDTQMNVIQDMEISKTSHSVHSRERMLQLQNSLKHLAGLIPVFYVQ
jgi:hypothetical protein